MLNFLIKCQDKIKEINEKITMRMLWNAACITTIAMLIAILITCFSAALVEFPVFGILFLVVLVFGLNVFSQMDLKKKD